MKEKKITQEKLCAETGISINTFRGSISKEIVPRIDLAKQIADYLNVSIDYLITGNESDNYKSKYDLLKQTLKKNLEEL